MRDWENDRDALVFEYLEGNLPTEEAAQLEKEVMLNHELNEEISMWKEAYLNFEYHDTRRLEKSLLKPTQQFFPLKWHLNALLLGVLVFTLSIDSWKLESNTSFHKTIPEEYVSNRKTVEEYPTILLSPNEASETTPEKKGGIQTPIKENRSSSERVMQRRFDVPEKLAPKQVKLKPITETSIDINPISIKKAEEKHKKKKKLRVKRPRQRHNYFFPRGSYVVPINPQNF